MLIKKIDILDCDTYEEEFVRYIYENNKCRRSVETKDIESAYKHFSEMKSANVAWFRFFMFHATHFV